MMVDTARMASYGLLGAALLNFILSLIMGVSMKFLWNLFATIQIIIHMAFINMPVPSHVIMCFSELIGIANLNMIPRDQIKLVLDNFVVSEMIEQKNQIMTLDIFKIPISYFHNLS